MAGEQEGQDRAGGLPAQVRRLSPDGWATLREVRLASLADAPYAFSSTLAREQGFGEEAWRDRIATSAIFVAWRGGSPAGMAAGVPERTARAAGFGHAAAGTAHLVSMWVCPQARGLGVAGRLVESVCQWARADGAVRVELWVTEVNARARAFYARAGFAGTGRRQLVRPEEPDHWEEQMALELDQRPD